MFKPGTRRKPKPSESSSARRKRDNPAAAFNPEAASPAISISHEEIAARAYGHFLARGGQHGDDWGDWFRAEAELLEEMDQGGGPPGR
jgi:hypothetical protein